MTIAVDMSLLTRMMEAVSAFGATADGGLNRQAGSTEHGRARDWFREKLVESGYTIRIDAIGNLYGALHQPGDIPRPTIMVGSHLDSQPFGGRFDGTYGVIAAFVAVEAVRKHASRTGQPLNVDFIIVDWMNEEGARFQPSLLGSSAYCGELGLNYALSRVDGEGLSVGGELERIGYRGTDPFPHADAYVEIHIEGNDELEKAGLQIGPFSRYWGALKIRAAMLGETAHTGPTRMQDRKDAGLGAALVQVGLREIARRRDDRLYTSCGRLVIEPNSPNMVPDRATMFIELRSPDPVALAEAEQELMELLAESAQQAQLTYEVISIDRREAGSFDPRLVELCEKEAARRGLGTMQLETIGGHDAVPVSRKMPGLVFAIPSVGGVIHHPTEFSSDEDLLGGANVLAGMLWELNAVDGNLDHAVMVTP